MFILHETGSEDQPVAVPFNIGDYDVESLEGFVSLLIEQYPPEFYAVEMVMYTRFDPDFQSRESFRIMFGAKDLAGAQMHTVYTYKQGINHDKMEHYKMPLNNFDEWIPADPSHKGFEDKYLDAALSLYHTLVTFKALKSYAK